MSANVSSDWQESGSAYTAKVGGIAGENNGTIEYCVVTGNVTNNDADVGGIAGDNDDGTIRHCTFYGTRSSSHSQDNLYAGDHGKEENCYDGFNTGEWDAANSNGKTVYRDAIKYPYTVNVTTVGPGTIRTWAADEYDVTGTYLSATFSLNVTSGTMNHFTITDAGGNNIDLQGHANDWSSFWFVMPKKNVNVTVYFKADWPTQGSGTAGDPYIIGSTEDWNRFAHNVTLGNTYGGKHVKLTKDISVSNPAGGSTTNSFQGTFDGDGHTLTFNNSDWTERFIAPFRYVGGTCTIKNLKTAGSISSSGMYATGLIAGTKDGSTITVENCVSSMSLNSTGGGEDLTNTGFVGRIENVTLNIRGCVFNGSFSGCSITNTGFVAWMAPGCTVNITDCLFAPSSISSSSVNNSTYVRRDITSSTFAEILHCYYTEAYGWPQGTEVIATTTAPRRLGALTKDYGMVKAYEKGLQFNGMYYT